MSQQAQLGCYKMVSERPYYCECTYGKEKGSAQGTTSQGKIMGLDGRVKDYGYFEDNKWVWKVNLRRRVLAWESLQWNAFMALLSEYQVCQRLDDELVWKRHSSGSYSTKSFCLHLANIHDNASKRWSMIWSGLLPAKVEVFCWQVFHGKVAVKETLARRGHFAVNVLDVFRDPIVVFIKRDKVSSRKLAKWNRPKDGIVKFNVDGSARGKPGLTGIGGLLRDHTG
ncbi:hypothetical protein PTKIN_Ptkin08bG0034900 [Pterospermum kingtungense]